MACNPDDISNADKDTIIQDLREENDDLKRKIEELTTRLSLYEIDSGSPGHLGPSRPSASSGPSGAHRAFSQPASARWGQTAATGGGSNAGRKSIPFSQRTAKQHQGRMAYLLKKLENSNTANIFWSQDGISDLREYFVSSDIPGAGNKFFRSAVVAFAGEDGAESITDIDTFIAMLQP